MLFKKNFRILSWWAWKSKPFKI